MPFIQAEDQTKLFYKDWGTEKPVVFVHGWCIPSDSWEYVMNDLPHRGLRCIAYDHCGCGRSAQSSPWNLPEKGQMDCSQIAGSKFMRVKHMELSLQKQAGLAKRY